MPGSVGDLVSPDLSKALPVRLTSHEHIPVCCTDFEIVLLAPKLPVSSGSGEEKARLSGGSFVTFPSGLTETHRDK